MKSGTSFVWGNFEAKLGTKSFYTLAVMTGYPHKVLATLSTWNMYRALKEILSILAQSDAYNYCWMPNKWLSEYFSNKSQGTQRLWRHITSIQCSMSGLVKASHHGHNRLVEFITGYVHPAHLYSTRCTRWTWGQKVIHNYTGVLTRWPTYLNQHKQENHHTGKPHFTMILLNSSEHYLDLCQKISWIQNKTKTYEYSITNFPMQWS